MNQSQKYQRPFHLVALLTLVVLVLEYILGMYTALFVEFPDSLVDGNAWTWSMSQSPIIMAHVLLGTLLVIGSLLGLGLGIAAKSKVAISASVVGLVTIMVAYLSGSVFLSNVQSDAYSFSMSLGFLGALLAYGAAYYLTGASRQTAS